MELKNNQQKHLRSLAHQLNPVVRIGQHGLTENVVSEIELALNHHELIKLKVNVGDRAARDGVISSIIQQTGAILVQSIGNVAVLFRRNPKKPVIELPR